MSETTEQSWFSDEALRKQAELEAWDTATQGPAPISMLCGVWQPRVQPTEAERCVCCGGDARDEVSGFTRSDGKAFCSICVGRGHDEDDA